MRARGGAVRFAAFVLAVAAAAAAANPVRIAWREQHRRRAGWYEIDTRSPRFSGAGALSDTANRDLAAHVKRSIRDALRWATEEGKPRMAHSLSYNVTVARAEPRLISAVADLSSYTGGAHPNSTQVCFNWGYRKGKPARLTASDLFRAGTRVPERLDALLLPRLRAAGALFVTDGTVRSVPAECRSNFVVGRTHLSWMFPPYSVGPYVEGPRTIKVPLEELRGNADLNGPFAPAFGS